MNALSNRRLYTFVDTGYLRGRSPELVTRQLCDGGADLIQLRAKKSPIDEVMRMAETMKRITVRANVALVINDHLSVAQEVGADFCHLGLEDFFATHCTHVSEFKGHNPKLRIGISTHAPEQAQGAVAAGSDYIAIGPVYATPTKPGVEPVTLEYVRWAAANVKIPWFAIGGINLQNLDEVMAAGATRVAVVSAILNAEDVTKACAEFRKKLG